MIYYYLYYKIYKFGKALSDDAINEWKPIITITLLEIFIIIQVFLWLSIIKKHLYSFVSMPFYFFTIGLVAFNYFIFHDKNKLKKYKQRFDNFTRMQNFRGGVLVLSIIILIVLGLIYAYYQFSLVDWHKIRLSNYLRY